MELQKKNRVFYILVPFMLIALLFTTIGCNVITGGEDKPPITGVSITPTTSPAHTSHGTKDDWQYSAKDNQESYAMSGSSKSAGAVAPTMTLASAPNANLGFSTGGAKDINNFRENIENNFLPLPTDVTYEGLFYDYYFDTGTQEDTARLFYPSYSYAVTKDPFSGEAEYYLSVGLNSGMKESDFQRKKLNLVVVLDISGSMSSPFDQYYYDRFGIRRTVPAEEAGKTKIQVARESVAALLDHLKDGDSFGMVLFNQSAYLAKPLSPVSETNMDAIKKHVLGIEANGSTNMEAGMEKGTNLFKELEDVDQDEYENRIIFLTDAMPNTGDFSDKGLLGITKANSLNRLYSTFIGIGVDFNTQLVEAITRVRGANYYSVHYSQEFKNRMDDEFEYMVTPLVFNLQLNLEASGWQIEKVYGSPEASEATGQLLKVNTLFPSKTEGGETRGGLVLLKMKKTGEGGVITLKVSYEDRNGKVDGSSKDVQLTGREAEYFENNGIRKGVLLSRYADLLKDWMTDERSHRDVITPWKPCVNEVDGIICPPIRVLNEWERQSMPLTVSNAYQKLFEVFDRYFKAEAQSIGDDTLVQEIDLLQTLINR